MSPRIFGDNNSFAPKSATWSSYLGQMQIVMTIQLLSELINKEAKNCRLFIIISNTLYKMDIIILI